MTITVGVFGAGGKMGSLVCRTVADDPDPVSHASAAGMVALKSDDELHLYFAIEARAA